MRTRSVMIARNDNQEVWARRRGKKLGEGTHVVLMGGKIIKKAAPHYVNLVILTYATLNILE